MDTGYPNAESAPSLWSPPHGLPLHELNESSFIIMDDEALDAYGWPNHDVAELGFIKQEPPDIPCSALGSLSQGRQAFANVFSLHFSNHAALANPEAVRNFRQAAAELQRRAQSLHGAEALELERAKRLKINEPQHLSASMLLQSPDSRKATAPRVLSPMSHLLSSPGRRALMSALQRDLSSPTRSGCWIADQYAGNMFAADHHP